MAPQGPAWYQMAKSGISTGISRLLPTRCVCAARPRQCSLANEMLKSEKGAGHPTPIGFRFLSAPLHSQPQSSHPCQAPHSISYPWSDRCRRGRSTQTLAPTRHMLLSTGRAQAHRPQPKAEIAQQQNPSHPQAIPPGIRAEPCPGPAVGWLLPQACEKPRLGREGVII